MRLHSLLRHLNGVAFDRVADVTINAVREDSRKVLPGDLFVARAADPAVAARHSTEAAKRGAAVVIAGQPSDDLSCAQIVIDRPAWGLSVLANAFHGNPSHFVRVLGVTGTNGKTTTAYLIRQILSAVHTKCGMIGTVEIDNGASRLEATMTTPDAVTLAGLLGEMHANHCRACAIEISSHALDQQRAAGVIIAGAGFTNLTHDHLDYHGTMAQYAAAKARLFTQLQPGGVAVVNADDPAHESMTADCEGRVMTFGIRSRADYRAVDFSITSQGSTFILEAPDGKTEVSLRLIGRHNIENALCAIGLCCEVFGLTIHQAASALREAVGAPGRLQAVRQGQPFAVLVDYAHTDDALRSVLSALRPLTRKKLRVVFGCGGNRDAAKRPRMAAVAEELADVLYITSDNPRREDPDDIIAEMLTGLTGDDSVYVNADRQAAIEQAIRDADTGDVVLIAGKGHENYQIIGERKHPFDDVAVATAAVRDMVGA